MSSTGRRWAVRLLGTVVRSTPADTRDWAVAMLAEIDVIDNGWEAFAWALGCTGALVRHTVARCLRAQLARLGPATRRPARRRIRQRTTDAAFGVGIAACLLVLGVLGVLRVLDLSWSQFAHAPLAKRALLVAALEIQFVVVAVVLWRARRFIATGVLVFAATVLMHFATHG